MNNKQVYSIATGASIRTTFGAITGNVAIGVVTGSIMGLLIGVVLALVIFSDDKSEN